ncbi:hypothetical protein [Hymenobacter sp. BRD67]|uniref:hypothetical protein n=1 Tax=Hymenobacter sp. BRD67 TaxID=2675877 RepID=UPI0015654298|nr:hypothetical protein [Hymenobacter sp. BRD67]QKG51359.1 hypothetical protein GKZ67_00645 [Hymenobacter sp. BRD67]
MKKSLLLLASMAFATASFAQTTPATAATAHHGKRHKTPEQRADHRTAMLTKKLSLSAEQQAKVHQILLSQAQEDVTIRAKYPAEAQRQIMHQEMEAGRARYQTQLRGVLSAEQFGKLQAMHQEHQHKEKGEPGSKAKS